MWHKALSFLDPYKPLIYAGVFALGIASFYAYGWKQYNKGYSKAAAEAVQTVAAERVREYQRQAQANVEAQQAALEAITKLDLQYEALRQKIEENDREAEQDPGAANACLGADSVRRLNQVR